MQVRVSHQVKVGECIWAALAMALQISSLQKRVVNVLVHSVWVQIDTCLRTNEVYIDVFLKLAASRRISKSYDNGLHARLGALVRKGSTVQESSTPSALLLPPPGTRN